MFSETSAQLSSHQIPSALLHNWRTQEGERALTVWTQHRHWLQDITRKSRKPRCCTNFSGSRWLLQRKTSQRKPGKTNSLRYHLQKIPYASDQFSQLSTAQSQLTGQNSRGEKFALGCRKRQRRPQVVETSIHFIETSLVCFFFFVFFWTEPTRFER